MSYWAKLLAHSHWITITLFKKELRVCARCSGIVLGFAVLRIGKILFSINFFFPPGLGLFLAVMLALPSIIDWTTQSLNFRESKNKIRMTTGFLEGCGIGLFSITQISPLIRILTIIIIGAGVILIGNLKKIF